jgi:hypothetical protein
MNERGKEGERKRGREGERERITNSTLPKLLDF